MAYKDKQDPRYAESRRRWYEQNKQRQIDRQVARKNELRAEVAKIKESAPCADCGIKYPWFVMDFDHIGDDKLLSVSTMVGSGYSMEMVLDEIAKCELVCANCHRYRTHSRRTT